MEKYILNIIISKKIIIKIIKKNDSKNYIYGGLNEDWCGY